MQTRVFSTWPCFRPPEMKLRCSCLCRPMPANCNKKDASTSEVQRLHDLQAPPMTNRTCPAHSSSGDTIFVGVHGSSYNSSPSSGGAGPLERHLEAAISRMPSSRQLPPETSRTARPTPTLSGGMILLWMTMKSSRIKWMILFFQRNVRGPKGRWNIYPTLQKRRRTHQEACGRRHAAHPIPSKVPSKV